MSTAPGPASSWWIRTFDAGTKAAEVTASLYGPIYSKIDPLRVAVAARDLELGSPYARRILKRYRPDVPANQHAEIVHRMIHAYPSHEFVIDTDELRSIGLPLVGREGVTTT